MALSAGAVRSACARRPRSVRASGVLNYGGDGHYGFGVGLDPSQGRGWGLRCP